MNLPCVSVLSLALICSRLKMLELPHLSACAMILSVLDRNQIFEPSLQGFRHVSREIMCD